MDINMIMILAILIAAICSFGYLAAIILADWRALGKTKGAPFSVFSKRALSHRAKPGLDCFGACMKKFAWDVDETSLCASQCRS
jgi:hypothetical protein